MVNPGGKLINLGQGLVLVVDSNGKVVHASEALNRLLGHAPGALIGKPPHFLTFTDRTAARAMRGAVGGALRRRDGTRQLITLREQ